MHLTRRTVSSVRWDFGDSSYFDVFTVSLCYIYRTYWSELRLLFTKIVSGKVPLIQRGGNRDKSWSTTFLVFLLSPHIRLLFDLEKLDR